MTDDDDDDEGWVTTSELAAELGYGARSGVNNLVMRGELPRPCEPGGSHLQAAWRRSAVAHLIPSLRLSTKQPRPPRRPPPRPPKPRRPPWTPRTEPFETIGEMALRAISARRASDAQREAAGLPAGPRTSGSAGGGAERPGGDGGTRRTQTTEGRSER